MNYPLGSTYTDSNCVDLDRFYPYASLYVSASNLANVTFELPNLTIRTKG